MTHILVFGDSTTYGAWDSQGGWVSRLRARLDKKNKGKWYTLVYNLGISGGTSTQLLRRFENETKVRLDTDKGQTNTFIFAGGANDTIWFPKKKRNHVPLPQFKRNMTRVIHQAKKYSNQIVVLGIKPCNQNKVDPIPWFPSGSYRMNHFEKYNNALKDVCADEKVHFINSFAKLNNKQFISTLEDGIHPLDRGHAMMEKLVWNFLKKKKWI